MQKTIGIFRKYQKFIFIAALIVSAVSVVFALSFSTGMSPFIDAAKEGRRQIESIVPLVEKVDSFNKTFFFLSIFYLLITAATFVFLSHKRRIYYFSNILTISLFVAFSLFLSVFILINMFKILELYNAVDFVAFKEFLSNDLASYTESRTAEYLGIVFSIITFLIGIVMLVNMLLRIIAIKKEKLEKSRNNHTNSLTKENANIHNNKNVEEGKLNVQS